MASCRLCFKDITFSSEPEYINKAGIKIPLDVNPAGIIIDIMIQAFSAFLRIVL